VTDPIEETARRIAELGHGALLRRLRPAFDHAAVTHAGRITVRSDELERMLEQAAQRADAAIWRRALASVAMDELDIGLFEALEHPAVIRAQEMVGAPALDRAVFSALPDLRAEDEAEGLPQAEDVSSVEALTEDVSKAEALTEPEDVSEVEAVTELPAPPDELDARAEPKVPPEPVAEAVDQTKPVALVEGKLLPEPVEEAVAPPKLTWRRDPLPLTDPAAPADPVSPADPTGPADRITLTELDRDALPYELPARPEPEPEGPLDGSRLVEFAEVTLQTIRLAAVHLEGIENLPRAGKFLELCFSDAGFDVVDADGGNVIGRLRWDEIDALELPSGRNSLGRRRRRARAQLVVRADRGQASFEIRGLTHVELREHLAPMMTRVRGARRTH
jgi:hypothetical protein